METKKVRILVKRLVPEARMPERANPNDAGADVYAVSMEKKNLFRDKAVIFYGTGLAFAIPDGCWMDLRPRSSVFKTGLMLCNSVGTIDAGYRGEVKALFYSTPGDYPYGVGDKVAQLVISNARPEDVEFVEVDELPSEGDRRGGFGSTGK